MTAPGPQAHSRSAMIARPSSPPPPWVNRNLPRAPLCRLWGPPRRARAPPIDYGDGLSPSLTNPQGTDITTIAQRRRQHPRRPGRDRSERLVAIRWNGWSRFAGMRSVDVRVIVTSTCAQ